jgi:GTP-binding protein
MFVDEAVVTVRSGKGGDGCKSFRREKFVPRGGPDGGNGGTGGTVWFEADRGLHTLLDLSRRSIYVAQKGRPGSGSNRTGRSGSDVVLHVPPGTIVREIVPESPPEEGRLLGDLVQHGERLLVAKGGDGGRGNAAFAGPTNRVPQMREEGRPGEERRLYLELRLLADVGLVGLPNAGKSTLLSRVSAAHPKIADYPFTTLKPNLGIVELGSYARLVFADLPGLIEGAHRGHGLGIEFLRHLERTRVLVHLVSMEGDSIEAVAADYRKIEDELAQYSPTLAGKPRLVAASKMDVLSDSRQEEVVAELARLLDAEVLPISSVTGMGLEALLRAAARRVDEGRQQESED